MAQRVPVHAREVSRVEDHEEQCRELREILEGLRKRHADPQANHDALNERHADLERRFNDAARQIATPYQQLCDDLKNQLGHLQKKHNDLQADHDALTSGHAELQTQHAELQKRFEELKNRGPRKTTKKSPARKK